MMQRILVQEEQKEELPADTDRECELIILIRATGEFFIDVMVWVCCRSRRFVRERCRRGTFAPSPSSASQQAYSDVTAAF